VQGDRAQEAMKIAKKKGGETGSHPTALEVLTVQCSSAALDDGGVQPERITMPSCTPWTYSNAYGYVRHTSLLDSLHSDCIPAGSIANVCLSKR
jgi:hypothetical protein